MRIIRYPSLIPTFKRLGRAYKQSGRPHLPDAQASYERALNLTPNVAGTLAALEELKAETDPPWEAEQTLP